ncbi:MAG TPA: dienelactone hydrolase [Methanobacterium subterraneum]|uniref:Dienelactone hydrolase n=1 Tax=Methanobacterium subterraneum TaxID=59277 RepID=A0A7J4TKX2_9EURY|nr:dienelactone hydrolase [Methanobacterium subterraneum]
MANIVIFHSVLGLRRGIIEAAEMLKDEGHNVLIPDLYNGETFDDMGEALEKFEEIGIKEMVSRTISSVKDFPSETVYAGFSNGGTSAELLAGTKPGARGCLLFHAALPLSMIGIEMWPSSVPVQVHYAAKDPWKNQQFIDEFSRSIDQSGASYEYFEYPCTGHLFTDPDSQDYHRKSSELLWQRATQFLQDIK